MNLISMIDARSAGLKVFFTGKPCVRGHIAERYVSNGSCYDCLKVKVKGWRAENLGRCVQHSVKSAKKRHAKVAAYKIEWKNKDRAGYLAKSKAYGDANKERISQQKKKIYEREKDRYLAQGAKYRAENRDLIKARRVRQKQENPEKFRAWGRRSLAKRRGAPGKHTSEDIADIRKMQKGRCAYCKIKLGEFYHVDHITALSRGGTNDRKNLQILCQPCNQAKYALDPIRFAQKRGMLL